MNSIPRIFLSFLVIGLCLNLTQPLALGKKHKGISFPKSLGSFLYEDSYDYEKEDPGLGVSFAFKTADGVAATIYVYDMNQKDVGSGTDDNRVGEVALMAAREIEIVAKREGYQGMEMSDFTSISVGSVSMWRSVLSYSDAHGRAINSMTLVTGYKGQFFKVRITGGVDDRYFTQVVEFFLKDLGNLVLKPMKRKKKQEVILNEERMNAANGTLYVVYTLIKQGVDDPYSYETEYKAHELVALAFSDKDDAGIDRSDTGLNELFKAYDAGFLKEYVWVFARNYAWAKPKNLRLDEFEGWRVAEIPNHQQSQIFY